MAISHFQLVHKNHKKPRSSEVVKRAASASCSTGGFYLAPKMGDTINSLTPLPITWDPSCLNSTDIDIYLISPGSALPRIHIWTGVALKRGTYTATLMPRWWNATSSQSLQISIVPAGQAPFMSQIAGGPVFTATYTTPSTGTPASADVNQIDSGVTPVNDAANAKKKSISGKAAAGVLIPLLFICLCVAAWFKMQRSKGKEKRKRWSEAVDKRMSTISTDWKSISAAGAQAAIRNSIAVSGTGSRNSAFSFGAIRPSSQFIAEGEENTAGVGSTRNMSQMRPGVGLRNPAAMSSTERVSRVSFAADTRTSRVSFAADPRPSGESRRTRAFHSAYIPPVPALPTDDVSDDGSGSLSPRQTQGPLTLTPEDIRARINGGRSVSPSSAEQPRDENQMDEVMPALSMMRTGADSSTGDDDFLFSTPAAPTPSHPKPTASSSSAGLTSPVMSSMPMQPMPASVMSPDDMLRAYAERKAAGANKGGFGGGISTAQISYPVPAANTSTSSGSGGMRTLFNASGVVSPTNTGNGGYDAYAGGASYAIGDEGDVGHDPYGGTV
ncbi:uncharacterized protein LACBIDRAFT_295409 [Laccaria bicolor S238N-H82]|uniref:Predicted protein n=1 Tax=Laccaria bicolor (strain S238N-H82 / ATCC MYA-4686) TaxID=486041 RepID=B0DSA4_LACBS|nr:uncharacterized protein LACBIDRAFT_295409 [Laccaria bicolor S238N-H82]EDR02439.1 predicted protein [Laccaria bicolor S238N-H82]|eukprot:XP_001886802.1 predicted protein [Laccaria bicolor S238N-H82]